MQDIIEIRVPLQWNILLRDHHLFASSLHSSALMLLEDKIRLCSFSPFSVESGFGCFFAGVECETGVSPQKWWWSAEATDRDKSAQLFNNFPACFSSNLLCRSENFHPIACMLKSEYSAIRNVFMFCIAEYLPFSIFLCTYIFNVVSFASWKYNVIFKKKT